MRTNIVLDDALLEEARRLTGIETKRALVHEALRALVEAARRRSLLEAFGRFRLTDDYDHRKLRRGEP